MHVFGVMNFVLGHKEKTDGQEQRSGVDLSKEDQPGSSPLGASGHPSPQSGSVLKSGCEEEKGSSSPPSPRASGHPSGCACACVLCVASAAFPVLSLLSRVDFPTIYPERQTTLWPVFLVS